MRPYFICFLCSHNFAGSGHRPPFVISPYSCLSDQSFQNFFLPYDHHLLNISKTCFFKVNLSVVCRNDCIIHWPLYSQRAFRQTPLLNSFVRSNSFFFANCGMLFVSITRSTSMCFMSKNKANGVVLVLGWCFSARILYFSLGAWAGAWDPMFLLVPHLVSSPSLSPHSSTLALKSLMFSIASII